MINQDNKNLDIFKAQSEENMRQLDDAVQKAKEAAQTASVDTVQPAEPTAEDDKSGAEEEKGKEKTKTETEPEVKTEKPEQAKSEDKTEKEEKPEQAKSGEKAEKTPEEIKKENDLARLDKEIAESQKFYLETKIGKEKKFSDVFKGLFIKRHGHEGLDKDKEIEGLYASYKAKVQAKAEYLINDARTRGAGPEELAKIMTNLLGNTDLEYAKTFDQVRAQAYANKAPQKIGEKMMKVSDWYRKLPVKYKIAVGVTFFGLGAGATFVGGIAPAAVLSLATLRRAFGGMVAGTGVTKIVEARQEKKRERNVKKEVEQFLEKMKGMGTEQERVDELMKRFAIVDGDTDKQFEKAKTSRWKRLGAGFAVGTAVFFSPSIVRGLAHSGFGSAMHDLAEKTGIIHPSKVELPPIPKTGVFATNGIDHVPAPSADPSQLGHVGGINPGAGVEHVMPASEGTPLTVVKGSSIEATLKHYLQERGIKNPGVKAHAMYRDYMKEYIKTNHDALLKSGKLHEYQEMLKTGRVNIPPGTKLMVDKNGLLKDIEGKMSLLKGHHVHGGHVAGHMQGTGHAVVPSVDHVSGSTGPEDIITYDTPSAPSPADGTYYEPYDPGYEQPPVVGPVEGAFVPNADQYFPSGAGGHLHDHASHFAGGGRHAQMVEHFRGQGFKDSHLRRLFPRPGVLDGSGNMRGDANHLKEVILGKHPNPGLRHANIGQIVNSPVQRQEFLNNLPAKHNREMFEMMRKVSPPKPGDDTHKWLARSAMNIPKMGHGHR